VLCNASPLVRSTISAISFLAACSVNVPAFALFSAISNALQKSCASVRLSAAVFGVPSFRRSPGKGLTVILVDFLRRCPVALVKQQTQ